MPIHTVRPNGEAYVIGSTWPAFSSGVAGGTRVGNTSDGSDTTTVRPFLSLSGADDSSNVGTATAGLLMDTYALGVDEQVKSVRVRVRYRSFVLFTPGTAILYPGAFHIGLSTTENTPMLAMPQSSWTEYVGPWQIRTPGGTPWTQADIDNLFVALGFLYEGSSSHLRPEVAAIYVDISVIGLPVATITSPADASTVTTTTRPATVFTYSEPDNAAMLGYEVVLTDITTGVVVWESGFVYANVPPTGGVVPPVDLDDGITYRTAVRVARFDSNLAEAIDYSNWDTADFLLDVVPPPTPTITATPDNTNQKIDIGYSQGDTGALVYFTVVERSDDGGSTWSIIREGNYSSVNMLTPQNASLEVAISGTGTFTSAFATIARSTAQADDGVASLLLTSTAASPIWATTPGSVSGLHVIPDRDYLVKAKFRPGSTLRGVRTQVNWFDAAGTYISSSFTATVPEVGGVFTEATLTATAPANAVYAAFVALVDNSAIGEQHYIDKNLFRPVALADYEAPPNTLVKYRARNIKFVNGLIIAGAWSAIVSATQTTTGWNLKRTDGLEAHNLLDMPFAGESITTSKPEDKAFFSPMGRSRKVSISDVLKGEEGELFLEFLEEATFQDFEALRSLQQPLLLVRGWTDEQWYISLAEDRKMELFNYEPTYRQVKVDWVEIDPPSLESYDELF